MPALEVDDRRVRRGTEDVVRFELVAEFDEQVDEGGDVRVVGAVLGEHPVTQHEVGPAAGWCPGVGEAVEHVAAEPAHVGERVAGLAAGVLLMCAHPRRLADRPPAGALARGGHRDGGAVGPVVPLVGAAGAVHLDADGALVDREGRAVGSGNQIAVQRRGAGDHPVVAGLECVSGVAGAAGADEPDAALENVDVHVGQHLQLRTVDRVDQIAGCRRRPGGVMDRDAFRHAHGPAVAARRPAGPPVDVVGPSPVDQHLGHLAVVVRVRFDAHAVLLRHRP